MGDETQDTDSTGVDPAREFDAAADSVTGIAGEAVSATGAVGEEAAEAIQARVGAVQGGVGAVGAAASGDIAGAVDGLAGAVAGAAGDEIAAAVQTGTQVLGAAGQLVGAGQQLASGNVGGALGGLGSAASQYIVPESDVQGVLSGTSQAMGGAGQALDGLEGMGDGAGGQRQDVHYHLELDGFDGRWGVEQVGMHEEIGGLYDCRIEAVLAGAFPEVRELLWLDVHLQIERGEQMRTVHGIVRHASVREHEDDARVTLEVVPAMWLLNHSVRSRTFTDKSVPEVVKAIYEERVGGRKRELRNDLTRAYPTHELLTQFQESDSSFIERRLEQEGIFTYFVHEGDHEVLVLADVNSNLPLAREEDGGRVPWCSAASPPPDGEGIFSATHSEEIGAHDAVVSAYNWTAPDAAVRGEKTGRGDHDPPLEVYNHVDALTLHSYDGERYGENDAPDQARMGMERLDLARQGWHLSTLCVGARPGHIIELTGCPDGDLDQRYLITSASSHGSANAGSSGAYANELTVIPADMPFRPAQRTPIPVISGHQTAMVVGPSDQEIHTDEHGRVQVKFHWDREHEPTEPSLCSCWVRVMHSWAGPGFGTTFIPRIGMEVVLTFLNGNPDNPLVVGCVYHGTNRSPVTTPDDKTQSAIRTKSSPNSDGYNEMRFEDKAGSELINVHAQKDYTETVLHDHSTHVKNNQSNTVDNNQTETIGVDQTMTVHGERTKTVDKDETNTVHENRTTTIDGNDTETVGGNRKLEVTGHEDITIHDDRKLHVEKKTTQAHDEGREIAVKAFDNLKVLEGANRNVVVSGQYNVTVEGEHYTRVQGETEKITQGHEKTYVESAKEIHAKTGGSDLLMKNDGKIKLTGDTKVEIEVGSCKIEMTTDKLTLTAGASSIELSPSGVKVSGSTVTSSAQTMNEITGLLVKIN